MIDVAAKLKSCSQLRDLTPDETEALAGAVEVVHGEDGHAFITEGDRADGCYIVLEGSVGVSHAHVQEGTPFKSLPPGELFGLVSLIDHGPRSATCRAVGTTTVARLSPSAFQLLHSGSPSLALHFRKLVARQLARDARALSSVLIAAMTDGHEERPLGASEEFHLTT